jgi:outer membrane lipoprotein-sorting protein
MKHLPCLPRGARWAVPAAIVAVAGGVLAGPAAPSAAAAPRLPARSAAQLLAALRTSAQAPPLSGTVSETVSLGLPALPSGILGAATAPAALLSGSHSVQVWYSGPAHYRLALPQSLSEYDLVRNGNSAWLWDSSANSVTHITLPAGTAPALPAVPLTPQQAASQALASMSPGTGVRVDSNVTVAGQAAYQLVLAPKNPSSLIGQLRIAIDSRNHVPLRVQVFAKGAASPAVQTGFTAVSFTRPPASEYAFTPPAGARVSNEQAGPGGQADGGQTRGAAASGGQARGAASGVRVIGSGWLTVADLPSSALGWLTGSALTGQPGSGSLPFEHSSSQQAPGSGGSGSAGSGSGGGAPAGSRPPGVAFGPLAGALLGAARPVHGAWGSGQLLRTSLMSVLLTGNGRILIGAVTPAVLYRAATEPGHPLTDPDQHSASQNRASQHGASRPGGSRYVGSQRGGGSQHGVSRARAR